MTMRKNIFWLAWLVVGLVACTVHHIQTSSPLPKQARWVVLPVVNQAEAPLAGEKVEALLDTALRLHGLKNRSPALFLRLLSG